MALSLAEIYHVYPLPGKLRLVVLNFASSLARFLTMCQAGNTTGHSFWLLANWL